jgi:hypothetical protein
MAASSRLTEHQFTIRCSIRPRTAILKCAHLSGRYRSIGKDRELVLDSDPDDNLLDELSCSPFDSVLIALRKSFSLTYPRNPFIDGLQQAMREIREIGVEALRTIPEVLKELDLKPLPPPTSDFTDTKAYLFQYCLARLSDLQVRVKYEGKRQRLASLIHHRPANDSIRSLRDIVSDTFEEMHSDEQHEEVLRRIRNRILAVLPNLNDLLVSIEIEPIADPRQFVRKEETSDQSEHADSGPTT